MLRLVLWLFIEHYSERKLLGVIEICTQSVASFDGYMLFQCIYKNFLNMNFLAFDILYALMLYSLQLMDSLLGAKPYMAPMSTMSSTGTESVNMCSSSLSDSSTSSTINLDDSKVSRTFLCIICY